MSFPFRKGRAEDLRELKLTLRWVLIGGRY
jgi:hypothetical protein